jgi:hypothetical protein
MLAWILKGGSRKKTVEQQLHAKVVAGAAPEDGRLLAGENGLVIVIDARHIEQFQFLGGVFVGVFGHLAFDCLVFDAVNGHWRAVAAMGDSLEEVHLFFAAIIDTLEILAVAERPVDGVGADPKHVFQLVHEIERIARRAIQLVHEGEDRHAAAAADFEQFSSLCFDAFAGVDDHDDAIDSGEHAIGVLGKILMARGVEQVDEEAVVFELEDCGADGDAALTLQLHPVGGRRALLLAGGYGAGQLHRAAIEQELLSQRGLAGVWMRDDRKGATTGDFFFVGHGFT